jgi:hypothetical protein
MSAKLVVTRGRLAGTEYAITEEVSRVGSAPTCELRLVDDRVAAHLATLEFRDGEYRLHNRSDQSLRVNGRTLQRRQSSPWRDGEVASQGDGLALRLHIEGDPAPAASANPAGAFGSPEEEDSASDAKGAADGRKRKHPAGPLAVIGGCVLLGVVLLLGDSPSGPNPEREFREVVERLRGSDGNGGAPPSAHLPVLQRARWAERRGDREVARQRYARVRDALLHDRRDDGTFRFPAEERAWRFVRSRLEALR